MSILSGGQGGSGGDGNSGAGAAGGGTPNGSGQGAGQGGQGGQTAINFPENWKDALPDDIKADTALTVIHDIPSLAKSYVHSQKQIGKDKVTLPNEYSSKEEIEAFYNKIGRPEKPEGYDLKYSEEDFDKDSIEGFKKFAHENGILPKQLQAMVNYFKESAGQARIKIAEEMKTKAAQEIGELKKEWGEAWDRKTAAANLVLRELGDENFDKWLGDSGLRGSTQLIRFLAKVGETLKEGKIVGKSEKNAFTGMTPQEIDEQIQKNQTHPAYFDGKHPEHKRIVEDTQKLFDRKYPAQQTNA